MKKWISALLEKSPKKKQVLSEELFRPIVPHLYHGLATEKRHPDDIYLPAFDRIFLQLKAFYFNGLMGDILEFGVYHGYTAHLIANCMERFHLEQMRLHLFDSFEGLPSIQDADRTSYECQKGFWVERAMAVPKDIDHLIEQTLQTQLGEERAFVVKGYFEDTLEEHITEKKIEKAALINLDCDLFSSSKYVLKTLFEKDLIQDGTILICDDWMTSFGNPHLGQRKAVAEIIEEWPNWEFEKYFNYGIGCQVFILHDLSIHP